MSINDDVEVFVVRDSPATTLNVSDTPSTVLTVQVPGVQGIPGKVAVGSTTTGAPGTNASVGLFDDPVTGTSVLSFTIPRGDITNVTIGTVTTGAAGSSATATITGTAPNRVLNFSIPQGAVGATGAPANLSMGTVTKGPAGSQPVVSLTGSAPNYAINMTLPDGATGKGVAAGGTTGQVLTKVSNTDYDTTWAAVDAGTSAATANTVVKRDGAAGASMGFVYLTNAPANADHATRKDYVDTQVATRALTTHTHTASQISDSTSTGRSLLTAADAAAARAAIGAGTSSVQITDATTSAKGVIQLAGDLTGTATAPRVSTAAGFTFQNTDNGGQLEPTLYNSNASGANAAGGPLRIGNVNGALRIIPYNDGYVYVQSTLNNLSFSGLNGSQGAQINFNYATTVFTGTASAAAPTVSSHLTNKGYVDDLVTADRSRLTTLEGYNKVLVLGDGVAVPGGTPANTVIYRQLTSTGRATRSHWGSGTTFPTLANGLQVGDTFLHTGLKSLMLYSVLGWRQADGYAECNSIAERDAISTNYGSALYPGFRVRAPFYTGRMSEFVYFYNTYNAVFEWRPCGGVTPMYDLPFNTANAQNWGADYERCQYGLDVNGRVIFSGLLRVVNAMSVNVEYTVATMPVGFRPVNWNGASNGRALLVIAINHTAPLRVDFLTVDGSFRINSNVAVNAGGFVNLDQMSYQAAY